MVHHQHNQNIVHKAALNFYTARQKHCHFINTMCIVHTHTVVSLAYMQWTRCSRSLEELEAVCRAGKLPCSLVHWTFVYDEWQTDCLHSGLWVSVI